MTDLKVCTILGARPQFIKAAVVSRAFKQNGRVKETLLHTGQHFDGNMSDIFFQELEIPHPDYNLDVHGGSHGQNTGRMLEKIEAMLMQAKPDWVLVYGDTDSTLAGALAAAKLKIPIAHVEAGLRSYNRDMPEEINRVMTDHLSALLLTPTETAIANLLKEGIADNAISAVGDVMYDAALYYAGKARKPFWFDDLGFEKEKYILATLHRAENVDSVEKLSGVLQGFAACGFPIILPLHPRTRARISEAGLQPAANIRIVEPVGYLEMAWLEKHAQLIATDSGGVQKEAFFHRRPCVTLRRETEWVELCENGWNFLVGTDAAKIASTIGDILSGWRPPAAPDFYGKGDAGQKIVDRLIERSKCAL